VNKFTFFSFLLFLLLTAQAQVTITQADFEAQIAIGETVTSFVDTLAGSVDVGGSGQGTWDFSGLQSQYQFDATSIDPSSAPESGTFSGATHVTYSNPTFAGATSESWVYLSIGNGAYRNIGAYTTATISGFTSTTTVTIDPPETLYKLPINYNDTWTESGTRSVNSEISGFPGQQYDVTYTNTCTVDAYGTITMPNGTTEDILRIKTESEVTSNAGGVPNTSTSVDYTFLAKSGTFLTVSAASATGSSVQAEEVNWAYGSGGGTSDVKQLNKLANNFSLAQNYPNPFNPTTNIQYSIPKQAHVTLKVYDILCNEVKTLVNQNLSAGVYNTNFNGSNLSSGIYFYTLTANNFTATKKLMLIK